MSADHPRATTSARESAIAALPGWLLARVLVMAAWVMSAVLADQPGASRTVQQHQGLFAWDGVFYRGIAQHGYAVQAHEALRFFPLYPAVGRLVGLVLLGHTWLAMLVVSNVAAFVFSALCHRIVVEETGDRAAARRAAWFAALFPAAFVLVWGYSEALMLVAAAATLLAARHRSWGWAAAFGVAAALTRPTGTLIALAVAVEALRAWPASSMRQRLASLAAVAAPPAGLAAFLAWIGHRFGDWRTPLRLQNDLRGSTVEPVARLWRAAGDLVGRQHYGDGLHAPFALAFIVLLVVVARRLPASYTIYAAAIVVLAVSADNINSLERYGLNAFPLVLGVAFVARDERVERATTALLAAGLTALTALAWLGAYVP